MNRFFKAFFSIFFILISLSFSNNILAKCGLNSFYIGKKCKDGNYSSARYQCHGEDFKDLSTNKNECESWRWFANEAQRLCLIDDDNDGLANSCDNCPQDFNPDQDDEDQNGIGNLCDENFVEFGPTPPAIVIQEGENDITILRGLILTPQGPLEGEVLINRDLITCVDESCANEEGADQALIVETNGLISPGLIDAHNHLPYNFLPEWVPNPFQLFQNRYQWADDPNYEEFVRPYTVRRSSGSHFCPTAKWAELRSLINGTTTVQGQSLNQNCIDGLVRNADHEHQLDYHDHVRTTISSVRDINDDSAQNFIDSFNDPATPTTRLIVHMAEGFEENHILEEFDSFDGLDPRQNRHNGVSLLEGGQSVLIHSIPLTDDQLDRVVETDSKIVWSPSSNLVLYGTTTNIEDIIDLGITTGIGPDWTISGEDNMLDELRFAYEYGVDQNIETITSQKLWEMATQDGSEVVGLNEFIGSIEVGKKADLVVFGRSQENPYDIILESRPEDVRLVFVDGKGLYGDRNLKNTTSTNEFCENFEACGVEKYICVQVAPNAPDRGDETLEDIENQLIDLLGDRSDELLDLVNCP